MFAWRVIGMMDAKQLKPYPVAKQNEVTVYQFAVCLFK